MIKNKIMLVKDCLIKAKTMKLSEYLKNAQTYKKRSQKKMPIYHTQTT